ncbi:adenylate kinase [Reticulomyxa filosa]|uniref:Adenylate kinase n=1 Tax=Reticulomyxa filosa TaxID=46433 RepID=X6M3V3_RETFI|nr:adenylate kinase [Reticulomyxa filosa]|eukprot:ETO08296.1 adenylate kinase [Reticulomyxa filosa]
MLIFFMIKVRYYLFESLINIIFPNKKKEIKLLITGPPGVGKSSISKYLSERWKIDHINGGDIIRKEIANGTALGKQMKEQLDNQKLVKGEDIGQLIMKKIKACEDSRTMNDIEVDNNFGWIIDGFPRNLDQFEYFKKHYPLDQGNSSNVYLLCLQCDNDKRLIDKLCNRMVCYLMMHFILLLPHVSPFLDQILVILLTNLNLIIQILFFFGYP